MVGGVGIEPTFAALSRRCLSGYKPDPKANISNPPKFGDPYRARTGDLMRDRHVR